MISYAHVEIGGLTGVDEALQEFADEKNIPYTGAVEQENLPEVTRSEVGDYLFTWRTSNGEYIRLAISDITVASQKFNCYLTVQYKKTSGAKVKTLLSSKHWDIRSNSSTNTQYTALNRWKIQSDWHSHLTFVADHLENNFESGDPFVWLDEVTDPGPVKYIVDRLIPEGDHTLIAADGGSLKSMTALACCLSLATTTAIIPGLHPVGTPCKSLYLDYETNASTHRRRVASLAKAKGVEVPVGMIGYKRMTVPITQQKEDLRRLIKTQGICFVVIDSAGRAVGGETVSEEAVQSYFNAVSAWGVTVVTIAHKSKANTSGPAGNAQWRNQARSYWELEATREHGANEVILGIHHEKVNEGDLLQSLSYTVTFAEGAVSYAESSPEEKQALQNIDLWEQIRLFLANNPNSTASQIAEGVDKSEKRVGNVLRQHKGTEWVSDNQRPAKWVLTSKFYTPVYTPRGEQGSEYPPKGGTSPSPRVLGRRELEEGQTVESKKQWWEE